MSTAATDFTIEILPCALNQSVPAPGPLDVTAYTLRDSPASINRAVERDLLSFRTGDVTMNFRNDDGYFDNLFGLFDAEDRWQLRIFRRGVVQFWGLLIGIGSIKFNRTNKTVEMTAYGLTRFLQDTSAEGVGRTFASPMYLTTGVSAGISTLVINDTTGLLPGDTIHITDEVDSEDLVIKRVISSTQIETETATVNAYTGTTAPSSFPDTLITIETPFYRFQSVEFLVRALFADAGVGLAEYRMSDSAFKYPAPSLVNPKTLIVTSFQGGAASERNGRAYITLNADGTYYQEDPEDDWTKEDSTDQIWIDWSKYYTQGSAQPAILLRSPQNSLDGGFGDDYHTGVDFKSGTKAIYDIDWSVEPERISKRTTVDGLAWTASASVAALPDSGAKELSLTNSRGCEYDPVRNALYCWWEYDDGTLYSQYYDITGGTFTDLVPGDGTFYFGFCYVADLDLALSLRSNLETGPNFQICAHRGTSLLWVRSFPRCVVRDESVSETHYYATRTMRYLNGILCGVYSGDKGINFIRSSDLFQSYRTNKIADTSINTRIFCSRVRDQYRIFSYRGGVPGAGRNFMVAARTFAGVIDYANFEGKSSAEVLRDLAVIVNAVFWIDDNGEGHFVARDLFNTGNVMEIGDRIQQETDDLLWDNTAQYVEVSASDGGEAVAGDVAFSANSVSVSSPYIPNAAFAQSVADSYVDFYSARRKFKECTVVDTDGHIYYPLDRVTIDGFRWFVYESDHSLMDNTVQLKLLEDV